MTWFNQLIFWVPLTLTGLILLGLFYWELRNKVTVKIAGISLAIVGGIYLLQLGGQTAYLYFMLKKDELGQYLLPGRGTNYFYQTIWAMGQSLVWSLAIGLSLVLVLLILKKILKSPLFDWADLLILILTIIVVGSSSVLILVIGSFLIMIFFLLGFSLRQKKIITEPRLTLSPFLLFVAFAILILNNFEFYWKLLRLLRLN